MIIIIIATSTKLFLHSPAFHLTTDLKRKVID